MAIAYVGGQGAGFAGKTGTTTVTFSLTGGLASVPAAGDLVIVAYHVGGTSNLTLTIRNASSVDYVLVGSELYQDDTYDSNLRVAYRFMPETPETTMVLSGTGSTSNAGRYTIHVFRNVDSSTPLDVAVVTAGNIDTRVANPGPITPVTAGAWIYCAGGAATATGGTYTASYLTDFRAGTTSDTVDSQIGAGYYSGWTSGQYDPAAFSGGGTTTTNDSWTTVTIALRPAVVPDALTATDIITGAPVLDAPIIGQQHILAVTGITTGSPTLSNSIIGQVHIFSTTDIVTDSPALGTPTSGIAHVLTATGITMGVPILDSSAIGQTHVLVVTGITTDAPAVGNPGISQIHAIVAVDIVTETPIVGMPTIGQTHILLATDLTIGIPILDVTVLGQIHILSAQGITTGTPTLGSPVLEEAGAGTDILTALEITLGLPVLSETMLGQIHALVATGIITLEVIPDMPILGVLVLVKRKMSIALASKITIVESAGKITDIISTGRQAEATSTGRQAEAESTGRQTEVVGIGE